MVLAPFTEDEARDLSRSLLPVGNPEMDQCVESIVREAAGSPFFVEQLARYATASESAAAGGISLADMVDARLRRLPAGARRFLEILAVAKHPLKAWIAYQAAGLTGDERALVASLRAEHLLRSSGSAESVEIYHDRIGETVAKVLEPDTVRQIHLSLAQILEAKGFDDPEALFEHYLRAGDPERAATQALRAAERATAALAFDRAALFYTRALELANGMFDKAVSVGMMEHLSRSEYNRYFSSINHLLRSQGLGLVHTIGCNSSKNEHDPFIQKYIFPGSNRPRLSEIARALERNGLAILDVENLVRHYSYTVRGWLKRFQDNQSTLNKAKYDAVFMRMWEYYLSCAIAAATAPDSAVYQVLFAKDCTADIPLARV